MIDIMCLSKNKQKNCFPNLIYCPPFYKRSSFIGGFFYFNKNYCENCKKMGNIKNLTVEIPVRFFSVYMEITSDGRQSSLLRRLLSVSCTRLTGDETAV